MKFQRSDNKTFILFYFILLNFNLLLYCTVHMKPHWNAGIGLAEFGFSLKSYWQMATLNMCFSDVTFSSFVTMRSCY